MLMVVGAEPLRHLHILASALDVVSIDNLRHSALQHATFATQLAVVQTPPLVEDIVQAFLLRTIVNIRWSHISILNLPSVPLPNRFK